MRFWPPPPVAQRGERFQRALTHGFVEGALVLGQFDFERDLRARRQFREDGALGPPQHERPDQGAQGVKRARVAVALDRRDEAAAEMLARAQQARIDDGEQAPQFLEIIFDRRSRQRDAKMGFQPLSRLGAAGVRVLDRLRLVEDDHAPVDVRQPIRLLM